MPADAARLPRRDTRAVAVQDELIEAIAADPDDPAPQLVIADWLTTMDDLRGELIVLDHADRKAGGLDDPEAIERYLLLAAEYGFPHAREEEHGRLPFTFTNGYPEEYELLYNGHHYRVDFTNSDFFIEIDAGAIDSGVGHPDGFPEELPASYRGYWYPEETQAVLAALSEAIRAGTPFPELVFPFGKELLPQYPGVPLRCYRLPDAFTQPRGLPRSRFGLAARDYHRWHGVWHRLRVIADL